MNYIKGKIRKIIYENQNGYTVALFKVEETNDLDMQDKIKKVITITGTLLEKNEEESFILYGEYINNDKYGYQYAFKNYEKVKPTGKDALIEYFSSSLIKGCGEKTAKNIVDYLGEDAINLIKDNPSVLMKVKGMSESRAEKIYESVVSNQCVEDIIIKLKEKGFSINECSKIYNKYKDESLNIIEDNIYYLKSIIDFNKLDNLFIKDNNLNDLLRVKACILEGLDRLSFTNGDTYCYFEEIYNMLKLSFKVSLSEENIDDILNELISEHELVKNKEKYYLTKYYDMEEDIANNLLAISCNKLLVKNDLDKTISSLEERYDIKYNEEQINAIKTSLNNNITIISGGPGTGKTTIVSAIVKSYINIHKLNPIDVYEHIALLAPTGRASRKLSLSTGLPASTIHRFLKWNKETDSFGVNEYNKNYQRLVIVDEVSMIDITLFDALIKGLSSNIQLILVGDAFQLPSVGPGLILDDLINSDMFMFCNLKTIYRQSADSYIPYLAREIKEKDISEDIVNKKDDYNFLNANDNSIKNSIAKICEMSREKGLREDEVQILAPMYKTQNGIDSLNLVLQDIYNPKDISKKEISIGDITYRVGDKVLQLVNNPDVNVYNGDIGYIKDIKKEYDNTKKDLIIIDFDGVKVTYKKEDMYDVKHGYAITIHKSQGSEFAHVIMPICKGYSKMLYNKLVYTGVSRAKKSLVIIGDINALKNAIYNDYSTNRKTTLKEKIINKFNRLS